MAELPRFFEVDESLLEEREREEEREGGVDGGEPVKDEVVEVDVKERLVEEEEEEE